MSFTNAMEGAIPMTIFTVLKGEHMEIRGLFKALLATPSAMDGSRERLFHSLRNELLSHARAEQRTVYDRAALRIPMTEILHAEREHLEIQNLLESLNQLSPKSGAWKRQLQSLFDRVEHHVQEEERWMFADMKRAFADSETREMAKHFHDAKKVELRALEEEFVPTPA